MKEKIITAAEGEHLLLKHNAFFCLMLGMVISGDFLYVMLKTLSAASWVITLVASLYALAILILLLTMFKVSKYSGGSNKRAFWYGDFKDEFSAFLNHKGYKYSCNALVFCLIATWGFSDIDDFSAWFNAIELNHYAAALVCLGMWSYALPVLLGLRAEQDE
ncbi:hypothetical protein [Arsukibacterium sp.]|uniref:hypothetical protein n=1 Tax=Arsukibacterium sp. TaxID=1977258 RepID=UPI001BD5F7EC|nr:hypothetical protein [Arsukibacterium sp.]